MQFSFALLLFSVIGTIASPLFKRQNASSSNCETVTVTPPPVFFPATLTSTAYSTVTDVTTSTTVVPSVQVSTEYNVETSTVTVPYVTLFTEAVTSTVTVTETTMQSFYSTVSVPVTYTVVEYNPTTVTTASV
jgi:hypothetical protein